MCTLIDLDIELNTIRSFLKTVEKAAEVEYLKIGTESEAGNFEHFDDEANAYYVPQMWEEIALRAALGELNALIEWELRGLAINLYSEKAKSNESIDDLLKNNIFKEKFENIKQLIEEHYNIKLSDMESYETVENIRKKTNSFKHRKGFKDFRNDKCRNIGERYETSFEEVFNNIDSVRNFFKDLWTRTNKLQRINMEIIQNEIRSRNRP